MRILMVAQYFDPSAGGSERQACQQAEDLAAAGADVTVLTRLARGVREQAIPGVREIRVGWPDSPGPREGGSLTASLFFGLMAAVHVLLRGARYDVLHLQGAGLASALVIPAARLRGLKVVAKVSGGRSGTEAGSLRARGGLAARLSLPVFRGVDAWIAVSAEIVEGLKADGMEPARVHRIPNGVDTGHFRPLAGEARAAARRELGWALEAPVAVFVGRLVASKGLMPFLEAWAAVAKPDGALLALLGDGPERTALETLVVRDASLRLLGSRDDVARVLGAADLFVFPSRREGMPNAVLEAMACGLPVAAFRIGGVEDLVTDGVEGVLMAEGDDAGLARTVLSLLADPGRLETLGLAARRRAGDFDRRRIAREILACCR